MMYPLRYLPSGYVLIDPEDDCDKVVDSLLKTEYSEEFCIALDFDAGFIRRLMEAGFLVMSMELKDNSGDEAETAEARNPPPRPKAEVPLRKERFFLLLPKLHLIRSALFFRELYIKKSIRHFLPRYELRINTDFDLILDKCVDIHGPDWLTPPLAGILKQLHQTDDSLSALPLAGNLSKESHARPVSFGVYRDGELRAGEFGVAMGRVYTSYSGYYEETNAGTVQMILMTQWLEKSGFAFLDFGMPLDYKTDLGARDITPGRFVELFRAAR